MSIQTQIERLTGAKAALKTAIEQKGMAVPEGAPLEQYAPLVEQIAGGVEESPWRKIAEIDVTEPVAEIVVSQDSEGNPFSLSDIVAFNTKNITIDETANGSIDFKLNDGILNMNLSVKSREGVYFRSEWVGYRVNTAGTSGFNAYHSAAGDAARRLLKSDPEKITKFSLKNSYAGNFTAGNLIVYGRD